MEEPKPSKLTLENRYGKISIIVPSSDLSIYDFVEDLVIPLLRAMGYHHDNIEELLGEKDD